MLPDNTDYTFEHSVKERGRKFQISLFVVMPHQFIAGDSHWSKSGRALPKKEQLTIVLGEET